MTLLGKTARALLCLGVLALGIGCDGNDPMDAGTDGGGMDGGTGDGATMFPDGTVFCTMDSECDDHVDCTRDSCGPTGTCRNVVDPPSCDDGIFCNGVEQCDPIEGCVPGERETCNDDNVCTIDRCNEETKSCDRMPRDQDEDGDADWFCEGGTDCNDGDPSVSGLVNEVCDDFLDNDCDEMVDESDCGRPRYDVCDDPLDITGGGFFTLDTDGASPDYALSCRGTTRDLVATFTLSERSSVRIEGEGDFFTVALSLRTECENRDSEIACETGFPGVIRRRALEPGTYFVLVAASSTGEIGLTAEFGPPLDPATNDLCDAPIDVSAGGRFMGSTVEVDDDVATTCGFSASPDLFYTFTTTEERDVTISALSATDESMTWALADSCTGFTAARRCAYSSPATGTIHQLPAGTYYLVVEGPSYRDVDFTLDVAFASPSPPPLGDLCSNAIALPTDGTRVVGSLLDKQDDLEVSCGFRYRDAVYSFTLAADSDVTVTMDSGGFSNISTRPTCDDSATQIRCTSGAPARQRIRNLAAGTYYVIAEASSATGFNISVEATTPPTVATEVTGNENCTSAFPVPATGGLFHGDTTAMLPDIGGTICGSGAASNDAVFQLTLATRSRVVASTEGSTFDTVLHVHQTMCADGGELYCDDDGGEGATSLVDQMLDPGTYFIVVDGFGSTSAGEYFLEVTVTP
ncbi:MAG: putative metal-binding motif-containing protein [Myxococcales bacterium]|nr:putative metal-binding motif-containing protein [Myxococcales bacterium]